MKILLWEMDKSFFNIVLWDGRSTYWTEEMRASHGYINMQFNRTCKITRSRFTLIGEL